MNNAPPSPERPRRAFLEPQPRQPFLKTREGIFVACFAFLFVLSCIGLFIQYRRAQAKVEQAAEQSAREAIQAASEASLEERLAKKRADLGTSYEGAFADTKNGDPFVETAGYAKLIELLAVMSPEATAAKAQSYVEDYAKLVEQPDLLRGEWVRVRGLIGGMRAVKLDNQVNDIRDVWRGTVAQPNGSEAFVFDFIGTPPAFEVQETVVEVDGLMYRTVSYESRTHEQRTAPYLLTRSIRTIKAVSDSGAEAKFWVILVGICVIIGYLLVRSVLRAQRRQNQPPTRLRAMLDERRHVRREQQP